MAFPRSGTVDSQTFSGTKDFIMARSSVLQNANIAAADHLKLDTVDFSRPSVVQNTGALGGSAIALDVTTAYVATVAVAAIGRFSVRGGKLYKLTCSPGYVLFSGATGLLTLQWFDMTSVATAIGQPFSTYAQTDASHDGSTGHAQAMYLAGGGQNDVSLIEVQITVATAVTQIGAANKGFPTVLVETY
jgi:hypothetical protein